MTGSPLVDTAWLAARLGSPGLRVLDATWYMPAERRDPAAGFLAAHIPTARRFDVDAVSDQDNPLPHMAPPADRYAAAMSALGVSDGDEIVFYDCHGLFSAARGWWLAGLFGHDAHVLDGGLPAWQRDGHGCDSGEPAPPAPARFTASLQPGRVRDLEAMRDASRTGDAVVLDARSAGRFEGREPEPRPGLPGGHIPGSRSLPYTALLTPDRRMLAAEQLRASFAALGADGGRPVVTTCGSGVSAAVLSLGLVVAGLPQGALYDGSWTEWASRDDTPKQRRAER